MQVGSIKTQSAVAVACSDLLAAWSQMWPITAPTKNVLSAPLPSWKASAAEGEVANAEFETEPTERFVLHRPFSAPDL